MRSLTVNLRRRSVKTVARPLAGNDRRAAAESIDFNSAVFLQVDLLSVGRTLILGPNPCNESAPNKWRGNDERSVKAIDLLVEWVNDESNEEVLMQKISHRMQSFDGFTLDLTRCCLLRGTQEIKLAPKPFDALIYLVENPGRLISKAELMQALWPDTAVTPDSLVQCLREVRLALGDKDQQIIKTVPRRGYIFDRQVKTDVAGAPVTTVMEETGVQLIIEEEETNGHSEIATPALAATRDVRVLPAHRAVNNEGVKSFVKRHKLLAAVGVLTLTAIAAAAIVYFRTPGAAIDSVAVMPFVNVSADPNTEYLSEGFSDSIINSLSRLPNLKVNSLNSVLRYKGQQIDPQKVGREQNVRAVVMGRMTQRGDDVTISAELVDVNDNRRLWGGQYNRKLSDVLVLQEEIAREISEGLRLRLTGEEKKQLAKQYTANNDAFLHYSLGNYYFRQNTKDGFEKAIKSFEEAIKIDPNYALAYAGLAATYQFMISRGFLRSDESEQKLESAALKALQLDDTLAEAHASLAVNKFIKFDWVGAEKEIKRALELDPNSSQANATYASYLWAQGRADEGLRYTIRARELESRPDRGEGAFAYYMARKYDKAIELYRKNLEKKPDNAQAQVLLGEAYVAKGSPAEGVAEMQKGMALDATLAKTPERWDRYPLLAYAYAAAGRRGEALKILDEQQRLANQRYVSPYNFAIIYTGLGDKDRAFEWLTKCVEQRVLIIFHLKSRPLFDSLRSDPRYPELLRRMNLEP